MNVKAVTILTKLTVYPYNLQYLATVLADFLPFCLISYKLLADFRAILRFPLICLVLYRGVPRGDAQDARASPLPPPPCASPPRPCEPPPPQPERLVMRKDEAVGNKKKMQVCLPKHKYELDNNFLTVEPRVVDPHCFDSDPDPAQNLDSDPDPGGGGRSGKNVHPPWQNPRYAPGFVYSFNSSDLFPTLKLR